MPKKKDEQKELENVQREAWKKFQKLKFDKMTAEEREDSTRILYNTMVYRPTPAPIEIPFDFWTEYENTDEIKDIKKFKDYVANTLQTIPNFPTKETWLDKERGIVPAMKREWKEKVEPFKNERKLKKLMEEKVNEMLKEGKDNFAVNYDKIIKKWHENIEDTLYQPTRKDIEAIEAEIKKRTA